MHTLIHLYKVEKVLWIPCYQKWQKYFLLQKWIISWVPPRNRMMFVLIDYLFPVALPVLFILSRLLHPREMYVVFICLKFTSIFTRALFLSYLYQLLRFTFKKKISFTDSKRYRHPIGDCQRRSLQLTW